MALSYEEWIELESKANELRLTILDICAAAGGAHMGGSLSLCDILTVLYYKTLNFSSATYNSPLRDRCVVSKGHAGILQTAIFVDLGLLDRSVLKDFNKLNSSVGIHLDSTLVKGLDVSTGSLGHGSALALGFALSGRVKKQNYHTFLVLGDGECDEGSVWESAMSIAHFVKKKVILPSSLITIVDRNRFMLDGKTEDIMSLENFAEKWRAFGFDVVEVDGHNLSALSTAFDNAKLAKEKPVCIIADTIKGAGISFMENNAKWHFGTLKNDQYDLAIKSLAEYYDNRRLRVEKESN